MADGWTVKFIVGEVFHRLWEGVDKYMQIYNKIYAFFAEYICLN